MQTITTLSSEMIEDIRLDISLGGDTQLLCDNRLRFIVIEKNIMQDFPSDCYFGFKFIYNKERVHVFQFDTEEEMMKFYDDNLKQGFSRRENVDEIECGIEHNHSYLPKWVEQQTKKNPILKCQIHYRSRLFDETKKNIIHC